VQQLTYKMCINAPSANITQTAPPYFGSPSNKAIQLISSSVNFSYPTPLLLPLWNVYCEQHVRLGRWTGMPESRLVSEVYLWL